MSSTGAAASPLRDWLVCKQITVSFLPTPLAEQVLTLDWPPETALRYLLTGADTLHQYPDDVALCPGQQLWANRSHRRGNIRAHPAQ